MRPFTKMKTAEAMPKMMPPLREEKGVKCAQSILML
jgi:hypothetical protein